MRVIESSQFQALHGAAFATGAQPVFAVLDGCLVTALPERLREADCESSCLFSGQLDPMLEAAAPQLVRLLPDGRFCAQVLRDGWNDHWGILIHTDPDTDLYALRAHLRRHLNVLGPDGHSMYFRFYDPRAFRVVVPNLDAAARRAFFGPIRGFLVEGDRPDVALYYARDSAQPSPITLGHS